MIARKKDDIVIVSTKKESDVSKIPVSDMGIGIGNEDVANQLEDLKQLDPRFTINAVTDINDTRR